VVFVARAAEVLLPSACVLNNNPAGALLTGLTGKARDGLYEPVLADSEREAVADLLQYLENVR
jgi:hypothetical protein